MLTACLGQGQDATRLRSSRMTDPFNAEANLFFSTTFAFWKFAVMYELSRRALIRATSVDAAQTSRTH